MDTSQTAVLEHTPAHVMVVVRVNNHPVTFHVHEATGSQIKETAIAQKVPIQQDFLLFEKVGHHPLKQIADNETVKLHEHQVFRATAPDDQS